MRIYVIRHADPDYENHTITPAGHQEAQALARRLSGLSLTHLYSSPLGRARTTARYTAELTKQEPVFEDWLAEFSDWHIEVAVDQGEPQRYTAWDIHGEIVRGHNPLPTHETWMDEDLLHDPKFVEGFAAVQRNSDAFFARHGYEREGGRYRIRAHSDAQIAVFCHNGFGLTWLAHLLALPLSLMWTGFWLAPSSVTTILFDERSADWAVPRCLSLGDVSHLYEARLPVQPRGIKANFR